MPLWAAAGIPYFIYLAAAGALMPRLRAPARRSALAGAVAGLALCAAAAFTEGFWLRQLVLPPLLLLVAYWSAGFLWVAPMEGLERILLRSDRALRIPDIAGAMPRVLIVLLEAGYAGIYPLIPVAFGLHLWFSAAFDGDHFWTVVLVTDFVCFGLLPWIQTRPPRAIEGRAPWSSPFRAFNLTLLNRLSIGVNTVPSGHAAEAVAVALLLSDAPAGISAPMWFAALVISAGAVFGRYHYAVDAVAGWLVAMLVWWLLHPRLSVLPAAFLLS